MPGAIATAYVKLIPTFDGQLSSTISKQLGGVDASNAGSKVGGLFSRGVENGTSGLKTSLTSKFSAATVAMGNIASKAFGSVVSMVGNSMDAAIKRVDTINNFPRIMEGMGIGADESAAAIQRLSAGIDGLPTALNDAVSGVTRFTAKNGDIDRSTEYFLAVNNAIAAGGQSMAIQSSALEQLSQSYSKGRMDIMEWRSLQQAMPAQLKQIAEAMGMTADELGDGLRDGSVSMDEFMDKIVELNQEGAGGLDSFEQQARKATGGIGTALTNVQNRVNRAVAGIIDAVGADNISGAINAFSSSFGKIGAVIGSVDSETGKVTGLIGGLKQGLEKVFDGWEPKFDFDLDAVLGKASEIAERIGSPLGTALGYVIQIADGLGGIIGTLASGPLGEILDGALRLVDMILEGVNGILGTIEKVIDFLNADTEVFDKYVAGLNDVAYEAADATNMIDDAVYAANNFEGERTATLTVNDQASSKLSGIMGTIGSIAGTHFVTIAAQYAERAAGGFAKLHAAGGFVTDGPIFLGTDRFGVGHIAGEAGREWIKTHADGTTSIVPIENRKYLKPYAQEIASMIGGTGSTTVYNVNISDFAINDDAEIRNATREYLGVLVRKGAMNVG